MGLRAAGFFLAGVAVDARTVVGFFFSAATTVSFGFGAGSSAGLRTDCCISSTAVHAGFGSETGAVAGSGSSVRVAMSSACASRRRYASRRRCG